MKFILKRPISVLLIYVAILLLGGGALYNLPIELIPEANFPKVNIHISWPFTSPRIIESQVVAPLESEIKLLPGIRKISSISNTGSGSIELELNNDVDPDFFIFELQQKVSIKREQLPSPYIHLSVRKYVPEDYQSEDFMSVSMIGDYPPSEITRMFHERVLTALLTVKGVSHASLPMEQHPQLLIKVDQKKCEQLGIPFNDIYRYIKENDMIRFLGSVSLQDRQITLLFKNQIKNSMDLQNIILEAHQGRLIRLNDVATIVDTVTTMRYITRINGENALLIRIQKESGANSLTVSRNIMDVLKNLEKKTDKRIRFIVESDQSETIRKNLRNLWYRSSISLLVIFLVLLFFLADMRSPVIILTSIFFSLLLTFIIFYILHYTINLFSLAGLALGFGLLVDNSIVVLEAIYHFREKGEGRIKSILKAVRSVRLPVLAASATTIVALIPIIYLTGELKLYYLSFVRAVVISVASSILVSFTLIPLVALFILPDTYLVRQKKENQKFSIERFLANRYEGWLKISLRHPRWVLLMCILWFGLPLWKLPQNLEPQVLKEKPPLEKQLYNEIIVPVYNYIFNSKLMTDIRPTLEKLLGGTSYWFFKHVEIGEIWKWSPTQGMIGVSIRMPDGTDPAFTVSVMEKFEQKALSEEGVKKVRTSIWPGGGFLRVEFTEEASISIIPYLVKEKFIQLAANFAGFGVSVFGYGPFGYSSGYGSGNMASYLLEARGYNFRELEELAEKLRIQLLKHRRIRNVNINAQESLWSQSSTEEVVLHVDRTKLGRYGLNVKTFLSMIQKYLQQENWFQKISFGEDELIFNIKEINYNNFSIEDLKQIILKAPNGSRLRVGDVANILSRDIEPEIRRENQEYRRFITFEFIGPQKFGDQFLENFLASVSLPAGYSLKKREYGFHIQDKQIGNILLVIVLSVLLVYMVTAALFESFKQPIVILLAIPMALTGVFLIFYLTATNFDQSAFIGIILLSGIVVNNSILLVHQTDEYQIRFGLEKSIMNAAIDRTRPILMTTLTTVLGMLPLVLLSREAAENSDLWGTLALSTIGGLITSTIFVLLALPAILKIFRKN